MIERPDGTSERPLRFEAIVCDLDGVVYRDTEPCPGAAKGLAAARALGVRVLFLTNNASRPPADVAARIRAAGVPAEADDVLTSATIGARALADGALGAVPEGPEARVLATGGAGVWEALQEAGLNPTRSAADPGVWALMQGLGRDIDQLDEAAYAVAAGARWLAVNEDSTLPTGRGLAIGNGSLVAALAHATGRRPDLVTGKPHAWASRAALAVLGTEASRTLAVGDRLDTDIAGAHAAGLPSALVLTGVSGRAEAEAAPWSERPDFVLETLTELPGLLTGEAGMRADAPRDGIGAS